MARIKMLKTACGPMGSFTVNQIAEVDDDTALAWAEAGAATILSTPTPPQVERAVVTPPETATAKPQRSRKSAPTRSATAPPRDPGAVTE